MYIKTKLPLNLLHSLFGKYYLHALMETTPPHEILHPEDEYIKRWVIAAQRAKITSLSLSGCEDWRITETKFYQAYLHKYGAPDYGRHLHNHPWWNITIVLKGRILERLEEKEVELTEGSVVIRSANTFHKIVEVDPGTITLFITGRKKQGWGFKTEMGFMPWRKYEQTEDDLITKNLNKEFYLSGVEAKIQQIENYIRANGAP